MKWPYAGVVGALAASSPLPFAVGSWVHGAQALQRPSWALFVTVLASLSIAGASLTMVRSPRLGALLASLGLVAWTVLLVRILEHAPALALALLLSVLTVLYIIWTGIQQAARPRRAFQSIRVARARGAALVALAFWGLMGLAGRSDATWMELCALALAFAITTILGLHWLLREGARHAIRVGLLLGVALVSALGIAIAWGGWWRCMQAAALLPAMIAVSLPVRRRPIIEHLSWWEPILGHPARLLVGTFLALCLAGSLSLALAVCSATANGIALVDAAFTAVSAVCVTGLIVLDTPVDFSRVGQGVILVLIQLGGLGIMTFSTAAMRLLGHRMSLRHEGAVAGLVSPQDRSQLFNTTRRLIKFTFATEALGAVCLFFAFVRHGDTLTQALWRAVFTSVSAFCNAGFALQSDNLITYQHSPGVLHVVAALIIVGGLSPVAVLSIPDLLQRRAGPIAAQIKIVLSTTLILLVVGCVFILVVEWRQALSDLPLWHRFHNAWLQSVTLRTAGFNSIDIAAVHPATRTLMIVWMFVGGSPGGTAGGIKTTTFAILVLAVVAAVRGQGTVTIFRRRLSHRTVYRAAAIATVGIVTGLLFLLAIQLTQAMPTDTALFETVSALGTVGLSIGGTSRLDTVGKVLIMICMFMGRVGPLTLFMFLSHRVQQTVWQRPEEAIEVG
jgi:trk system potassium uptake protein TrkH